jgi:hypothetical protein
MEGREVVRMARRPSREVCWRDGEEVTMWAKRM